MSARKGTVISIAILLVDVLAADAGFVLDFQSLEQRDEATHYHGTSYSEGGFTVSIDPPNHDLLASFGTEHQDFAGSTAMYSTEAGGPIRLSRSLGRTFRVSHIDLAPVQLGRQNVANVTFVGSVSGGGSVSQTFALNGSDVLQAFEFDAGFTNLTTLTWQQGTTAQTVHQFDNIVLHDFAAVPEPASLAMWSLGALGLVIARRRKRMMVA